MTQPNNTIDISSTLLTEHFSLRPSMGSFPYIKCLIALLYLIHTTRCEEESESAESTCPADGCKDDQSNEKSKQTIKRRIIFDSDPGLDDGFALIWLLDGFKNGLYSIEALTSIQGNIGALDTYRNVMHFVNLSMPTSTSKTKAIRSKLKSIPIGKTHTKDGESFESLDGFHGDDGIAGISTSLFKEFPNVFASKSKIKKWFNNDDRVPFSEDLIIEKLEKYPYEISILCAGPVTNLYRAEQKKPGILSLARDILIMGGTFQGGNVADLAEFNFATDPKAIYEFFEIINDMKGRVPNVLLFPLDVTRQLQWNVEKFELLYSLLDSMKQSEIEFCRMKIDGVDDEVSQMYDMQQEDVYCTQTGLMYQFFEKATERMIIAHYEWGIGDWMELHDLTLVGFLLYPHLFDFKYVTCVIDESNGMIHFDQRLHVKTAENIKRPNCMVALDVDEKQFIKAFTRDIKMTLESL